MRCVDSSITRKRNKTFAEPTLGGDMEKNATVQVRDVSEGNEIIAMGGPPDSKQA